ncbi:UDP-4-amino-4,6-dideoxy-N-acetyl-beta-L-altrosamine transaminase [Ruegeria sp. ANG-S4]|uniref:UDP-4-amino-4, 6-dideoxy-N-acetyl-beta-L-altrosamine transaminase n=1 Tax=Ruegeria sp. ANG-S4 TaxID=1577904 RepID=UPI00315B3639
MDRKEPFQFGRAQMIPYGRQDINEDDIDAVVAVLKSDFLTQGPAVPRFEDALASKVRASHAVAVNSATSALHVALAALDVGPGDLIWTSPITFVASANCALYCGADVDFVDIDPRTYNMCANALEQKLHKAALNGKLPKAIIPVHMSGQSPDMHRISELVADYGIHVVEDASHAIGAEYKGTPVGDCAHSAITVFSFHPVKIITSAEGGMATTNNPRLAERMAMLRSHGVTRDPSLMRGQPDGPWYYQQIDLGWNYRMTDVQAALGLSQLSRLDEFVQARNEHADRYDELLADIPIGLPNRLPESRSAFHLYVVRLQTDNAMAHRSVFEDMRNAGIGVNLHYIPVHVQPYYRDLGFSWGDFPQAETYYQQAMTLPLFPGLTSQEQEKVVETLKNSILRRNATPAATA